MEACLLFENSYPIPIYIAGAYVVSLPKECTDAENKLIPCNQNSLPAMLINSIQLAYKNKLMQSKIAAYVIGMVLQQNQTTYSQYK